MINLIKVFILIYIRIGKIIEINMYLNNYGVLSTKFYNNSFVSIDPNTTS